LNARMRQLEEREREREREREESNLKLPSGAVNGSLVDIKAVESLSCGDLCVSV